MGRSKEKIAVRVFIVLGVVLLLFGLADFINKKVEDGNRSPPTSAEITAEYRRINIYEEDRETDALKIIAKSGLMIARAHYQTKKPEGYLGDYYTKEMKRIGYLPTDSGTNPAGEKFFIYSSDRYTATLQFSREGGGLIYYLGIESKG